MGYVTNKSGKQIDFEQAVNVMDDDMRNEIHNELAPCTEQDFFTAYEKLFEERTGEEWELSQSNPVW